MSYSLTAAAFVLVFMAIAWLYGLGILARLNLLEASDDTAPWLLAAPTGIGILLLLLFLLASLGQLKPLPILLTTATGLAPSVFWLRRYAPDQYLPGWLTIDNAAGWGRSHPLLAITLLFGTLLLFLLAMQAPLEWDELAYQLPHARDWASAGSLVVSEQLRFPLHAFNLQLLWASALLFSNEAATHLVNAFLAVLLGLGVFAFSRRRFETLTGALAALLSLYLLRDQLGTAYVDLGLAVFIFYAFLALTQWLRSGKESWLLVAAFLLATAAGIKYQGLLQLPIFALALVLLNRSPRIWLQIALVLMLFGTWWYFRNWLISGDPLHPLGARLFGYWLWDEGDLLRQHAQIDRYDHHLPWFLWPALLFPFLNSNRRPEDKALIVLGLGGVLAWHLTTRYGRYLLPTLPFLAIMFAQVAIRAAGWLSKKGGFSKPLHGLRTAGVLMLTIYLAFQLSEAAKEACFSRACVERNWSTELGSWKAVQAVPGFNNLRPYQFGLENELYVLGENAVGDWSGPWRYRDLHDVMNEAPDLRKALQGVGRDSIIVNRQRTWFDEFPESAALVGEFVVLYEDENVSVYKIRSPN